MMRLVVVRERLEHGLWQELVKEMVERGAQLEGKDRLFLSFAGREDFESVLRSVVPGILQIIFDANAPFSASREKRNVLEISSGDRRIRLEVSEPGQVLLKDFSRELLQSVTDVVKTRLLTHLESVLQSKLGLRKTRVVLAQHWKGGLRVYLKQGYLLLYLAPVEEPWGETAWHFEALPAWMAIEEILEEIASDLEDWSPSVTLNDLKLVEDVLQRGEAVTQMNPLSLAKTLLGDRVEDAEYELLSVSEPDRVEEVIECAPDLVNAIRSGWSIFVALRVKVKERGSALSRLIKLCQIHPRHQLSSLDSERRAWKTLA